MKNIKKSIALLVALVAGLYLSYPTPVMAVAGTVYFSPSSGRIDPGSTFTVRVLSSAPDPGNFFAIYNNSITVTYPNTMLQVLSTSTTGNAIGGTSRFNQTAGTASLSVNAFNAPLGNDQLLFTITFKAIGTGNATLGFTSGTTVAGGPTTKQPATLTIAAAPPATCPSGQVGTPPNCRAPAPAPTPAPAAPTTDAIIDVTPETTEIKTDDGELTVDNVTIKTGWQVNTINWTTSLKDTLSTLAIGTDKENLAAFTEITSQEDGTSLATLKELTPGTRYYYTISTALTTDPEKKATYTGAFTTKGYPVTLHFTQDNEPLVGARVNVNKGSYITDKNGDVYLELAAKSYDATITASGGIASTVKFAVAKKSLDPGKDSPSKQTLSFAVSPPVSSSASSSLPIGLLIASIGAGLLLIGGIIGYLLYRRRKAEQLSTPLGSVDEYSWSPPSSTEYNTQPAYQEPPMYQAEENADPIYQVESEQNNDSLYDMSQDYDTPAPESTSTSEITSPEPSTIPEPLLQEASIDQEYHEQPQPLDTDTSIESYATEPYVASIETPVTQEQEVAYSEPDEVAATQTPQEPGAIFDPTTGELDIIHHVPEPRPHGGQS